MVKGSACGTTSGVALYPPPTRGALSLPVQQVRGYQSGCDTEYTLHELPQPDAFLGEHTTRPQQVVSSYGQLPSLIGVPVLERALLPGSWTRMAGNIETARPAPMQQNWGNGVWYCT